MGRAKKNIERMRQGCLRFGWMQFAFISMDEHTWSAKGFTIGLEMALSVKPNDVKSAIRTTFTEHFFSSYRIKFLVSILHLCLHISDHEHPQNIV